MIRHLILLKKLSPRLMVFTVVAVVVLAAFIYLLVRPNKYADNNEVKLDTSRI